MSPLSAGRPLVGSVAGPWAVLRADGRLTRWLGTAEDMDADGRDIAGVVDGGVTVWRLP